MPGETRAQASQSRSPSNPTHAYAHGRSELNNPSLAEALTPAEDPHNPLPYPEDRAEIQESLKRPWSSIWLRILAGVLEIVSDALPKQLNYSEVTPQIAVGGSFRNGQIHALKARGVTAVVDCREEARDDPRALERANMLFLHLPAPDHHAMSFEQLSEGVDWVLDHIGNGGHAFLHCEHGVGRGPLMACAVLVAQGYTAPAALRIVRTGRWQAAPNDRQLRALLEFERAWRARRGGPATTVGED